MVLLVLLVLIFSLFSAELEALVKSASSHALYANIDVKADRAKLKEEDFASIVIEMEYFEEALLEIEPAFGASDDELKTMLRGKLVDYSPEYDRVMETGRGLIRQTIVSDRTALMTLLLEGKSGSGMTAMAAKLAMDSKFPFVKVISPNQYIGMTELQKAASIAKTFEDAYKSHVSMIVLDDLERLLEYVPLGPRFSNAVLQTLMVVLKRIPPADTDDNARKLMVIATTSSARILDDMDLRQVFQVVQHVPQIATSAAIKKGTALRCIPLPIHFLGFSYFYSFLRCCCAVYVVFFC